MPGAPNATQMIVGQPNSHNGRPGATSPPPLQRTPTVRRPEAEGFEMRPQLLRADGVHQAVDHGEDYERPHVQRPRRPILGNDGRVCLQQAGGLAVLALHRLQQLREPPEKASRRAWSLAKLQPSSPNADRCIRTSLRRRRSSVTGGASMGTRRACGDTGGGTPPNLVPMWMHTCGRWGAKHPAGDCPSPARLPWPCHLGG